MPDAVPGVLDRELRLVPGEARLALGRPVLAELRLDLVELLARVALAGFPAVTVRRGIVRVVLAALDVAARLIVFAPVSVLGRGVNRLGDAFAGQTACDRADDGPDSGSDRPDR